MVVGNEFWVLGQRHSVTIQRGLLHFALNPRLTTRNAIPVSIKVNIARLHGLASIKAILANLTAPPTRLNWQKSSIGWSVFKRGPIPVRRTPKPLITSTKPSQPSTGGLTIGKRVALKAKMWNSYQFPVISLSVGEVRKPRKQIECEIYVKGACAYLPKSNCTSHMKMLRLRKILMFVSLVTTGFLKRLPTTRKCLCLLWVL